MSNRRFGRRRNRRRIGRSGSAVIEMAVVLPVLIFICMGMADFAQYFYVKAAFQAAARDVARCALPANAAQGDPVSVATATLAQSNITFNSSWMTLVNNSNGGSTIIDVSTVSAGSEITVTIQVPYNQLPNACRPFYQITGQGIGNGKTITAVSTAVRE